MDGRATEVTHIIMENWKTADGKDASSKILLDQSSVQFEITEVSEPEAPDLIKHFFCSYQQITKSEANQLCIQINSILINQFIISNINNNGK